MVVVVGVLIESSVCGGDGDCYGVDSGRGDDKSNDDSSDNSVSGGDTSGNSVTRPYKIKL